MFARLLVIVSLNFNLIANQCIKTIKSCIFELFFVVVAISMFNSANFFMILQKLYYSQTTTEKKNTNRAATF